MASSLPFNDYMQVAVQPDEVQIKLSLFGPFSTSLSRQYEYTVINYRDSKTHRIAVEIDEVKREESTESFWLEGRILAIDGEAWRPPDNRFQAQYIDRKPDHGRFKIISHV